MASWVLLPHREVHRNQMTLNKDFLVAGQEDKRDLTAHTDHTCHPRGNVRRLVNSRSAWTRKLHQSHLGCFVRPLSKTKQTHTHTKKNQQKTPPLLPGCCDLKSPCFYTLSITVNFLPHYRARRMGRLCREPKPLKLMIQSRSLQDPSGTSAAL